MIALRAGNCSPVLGTLGGHAETCFFGGSEVGNAHTLSALHTHTRSLTHTHTHSNIHIHTLSLFIIHVH